MIKWIGHLLLTSSTKIDGVVFCRCFQNNTFNYRGSLLWFDWYLAVFFGSLEGTTVFVKACIYLSNFSKVDPYSQVSFMHTWSACTSRYNGPENSLNNVVGNGNCLISLALLPIFHHFSSICDGFCYIIMCRSETCGLVYRVPAFWDQCLSQIILTNTL